MKQNNIDIYKLINKNVLITGAGKGIGRALVDSLISKNIFIYALTRSKKDLNKLNDKKNIKIFYGDVSNINLIKKIFKYSEKEKKYINAVVNNAGIRQRKKFVNIKSKDLQEILKINFISIFEIMKIFSVFSIKHNLTSSIVNIGSIVGENGFKELAGYSASKGALKSLTKSFAVEYAKKNIRANVINLGFIKTSYYEKFKKKNKNLYNWTLSRTPQGRWGEPLEVVNLIEFLLSDKASYITGANINIDGGWLGREYEKKILVLIPTRLNSQRLPAKALLPINKLPLIVHVYRRAKLSKKVDEVFICCDDKKIFSVARKFGAKAIITSKHHSNGTERICEAFRKIKKKYDLVVDVQGDEPLVSPDHIDKVISYHLKNLNTDIVLPNLKIKSVNNTNIVKLVTNEKMKFYIYLEPIFLINLKKKEFIKKHLSVISFKPDALIKFAKAKKSSLEDIEDIELLRALDIGLKIKTLNLSGDSFSIDIFEDYAKAQYKIKKDKYFKLYK